MNYDNYSTEIVASARGNTQDLREILPEAYVWTETQISDNAVLIIEIDSEYAITYGIQINGIIVAKTNRDYRAPQLVSVILQ